MAKALPKVALFGANGQLGNIVLQNLSKLNVPKINCLIRQSATRLKDSELVNNVIVGDCSNVNDCRKVCKDVDIAISTITPPPTSKNFVNELVFGTKNIIEAAKSSGVERVIIVGGAGGMERSSGKYVMDTLPGTFLRLVPIYHYFSQAHKQNLELLKESGLNYTFFAPGFMWHAGKKSDDKNVEIWVDQNDKMWQGLVCTYEDIGYAIAKEAIENNFINKRVGIESSDQYWLSLFKGSLLVANWQLKRWSNFHH
jgi:putative NADH-flavin reductase